MAGGVCLAVAANNTPDHPSRRGTLDPNQRRVRRCHVSEGPSRIPSPVSDVILHSFLLRSTEVAWAPCTYQPTKLIPASGPLPLPRPLCPSVTKGLLLSPPPALGSMSPCQVFCPLQGNCLPFPYLTSFTRFLFFFLFHSIRHYLMVHFSFM